MGKKLFVRDLEPKNDINDLFLVKYIAVNEARDGRQYLNVILTDKTGDIEARKWHGAEQVVQRVSKGRVVKVLGKINRYQGRNQVIISEIDSVEEDSFDSEDFRLRADTPAEEMYEELLAQLDILDDVYIRDLLLAVLHDPEVKRRLLKWPAGKSIHHAYQSGLLEHILSCTKLAASLSLHYKVNRNYVIAGAILHDLCKIYELSDGLLTDYTEEGKLVGHLAKGLEIVDRYAARIGQFPHDMKNHLKHIILSHHGEYEFGSPKLPQTKEAMLVHYIDLLDSKLNSAASAIEGDHSPGSWTGFIKHLDRVLYKDALPTYTDYLPQEEEGAVSEDKSDSKKKKKYRDDGELKYSMANVLKDIKIDPSKKD